MIVYFETIFRIQHVQELLTQPGMELATQLKNVLTKAELTLELVRMVMEFVALVGFEPQFSDKVLQNTLTEL